MNEESRKKADEILVVLREALNKLNGFYDGRQILGALIGTAGMYAGSLRQLGVLTEDSVAEFFAIGLSYAMDDVDPETLPKLVIAQSVPEGLKQ